jgi:hypothetical protein
MGIENRKHPRRHVQQFGMILSALGRCTMLDVSATGAQLSVNTTSELPNEFTLVLSKTAKCFDAARLYGETRILWVSGFLPPRPRISRPSMNRQRHDRS